LTVLAAIWPSWRILYPNSGSLEGRGAVDGRDVSRRDAVAGMAASRSRTLHSAGVVVTAPGVELYARGRPPRR
jgi:hypothetical protein